MHIKDDFSKALLSSIPVRFSNIQYIFINKKGFNKPILDSEIGLLSKIEPEVNSGEPSELRRALR